MRADAPEFIPKSFDAASCPTPGTRPLTLQQHCKSNKQHGRHQINNKRNDDKHNRRQRWTGRREKVNCTGADTGGESVKKWSGSDDFRNERGCKPNAWHYPDGKVHNPRLPPSIGVQELEDTGERGEFYENIGCDSVGRGKVCGFGRENHDKDAPQPAQRDHARAMSTKLDHTSVRDSRQHVGRGRPLNRNKEDKGKECDGDISGPKWGRRRRRKGNVCRGGGHGKNMKPSRHGSKLDGSDPPWKNCEHEQERHQHLPSDKSKMETSQVQLNGTNRPSMGLRNDCRRQTMGRSGRRQRRHRPLCGVQREETSCVLDSRVHFPGNDLLESTTPRISTVELQDCKSAFPPLQNVELHPGEGLSEVATAPPLEIDASLCSGWASVISEAHALRLMRLEDRCLEEKGRKNDFNKEGIAAVNKMTLSKLTPRHSNVGVDLVSSLAQAGELTTSTKMDLGDATNAEAKKKPCDLTPDTSAPGSRNSLLLIPDRVNAIPQCFAADHGGVASSSPITVGRSFNVARLRARWGRVLRDQQRKRDRDYATAPTAGAAPIRSGLSAAMHTGGSAMEALFEVTSRDDVDESCSSTSTSNDSLSSSSSSSVMTSSEYDTSDEDSLSNDVESDHIPTHHVRGGTCADIHRYLASPFPLHMAILEDDSEAVLSILSLTSAMTRRDASAPAHALGGAVSEPEHWMYTSGSCHFPAVHLAAYLDSANILRILLSDSSKSPQLSVHHTDTHHRTPLMIASARGCDKCVTTCLSYGAKLLIKDIVRGDTALHLCCRRPLRCDDGSEEVRGDLNSSEATLRALVSAASKKAGQISQKLMCIKNSNGETPLHVACSVGNAGLVDEMLTSSPSACIKAMFLTDKDGRSPILSAIEGGSQDAVTTLLVWRGNHQVTQRWRKGNVRGDNDYESFFSRPFSEADHTYFKVARSKEQSSTANSTLRCPLTLAISRGDFDMAHLLLELGDSMTSAASSPYDVDGALRAAVVRNYEDEDLLQEVVNFLVESGANPYASADVDGATISSPICFLATNGKPDTLRVMLEAYDVALLSGRWRRRNDPVLRHRPQSYFDYMEAKENEGMKATLAGVLVASLTRSWEDRLSDDEVRQLVDNNEDDSWFPSGPLRTSLYLMRGRRTMLDEDGFLRLMRNLARASNKTLRFHDGERDENRFEAEYIHYGPPSSALEGKFGNGCSGVTTNYFRASIMSYWSTQLLGLPWIKWSTRDGADSEEGLLSCGWFREEISKGHHKNDGFFGEDWCFLLVDGQRLVVHKSILSAKCRKLAAAFRFARMNRCSSAIEDDVDIAEATEEIPVNISLQMVTFLVQHCYHGSIVSGLSSDRMKCFQELMELALVAEEFLCPSLLLECEMRMLSARFKKCFCWCCCATVHDIENASNGLHLHVDDVTNAATSVFLCKYRIRTPSSLINVETALDVISFAQHTFSPREEEIMRELDVGTATVTATEHTTLSQKREHKGRYQEDYISFEPFLAAKSIALKAILQNFAKAIETESYQRHFSDVLSDMRGGQSDNVRSAKKVVEEEVELALLQNCLDELVSSSIICDGSNIIGYHALANKRNVDCSNFD